MSLYSFNLLGIYTRYYFSFSIGVLDTISRLVSGEVCEEIIRFQKSRRRDASTTFLSFLPCNTTRDIPLEPTKKMDTSFLMRQIHSDPCLRQRQTQGLTGLSVREPSSICRKSVTSRYKNCLWPLSTQ